MYAHLDGVDVLIRNSNYKLYYTSVRAEDCDRDGEGQLLRSMRSVKDTHASVICFTEVNGIKIK